MSKHTPGPWHWVDRMTDVPVSDIEKNGLGGVSLRTIAERRTSFGSILPEFILDVDQLHDPNANANARLIASAPQLLEALKLATDIIYVYQSGYLPKHEKLLKEFCAAIRAAEGEE